MSNSIYIDAIAELQPGNTHEVIEAGHVIHVTATNHTGLNTGRRRYQVECVTCKERVHVGTTGPRYFIEAHVREKSKP